MMQNQRDNLHQQVLNTITGLLEKGEFKKDGEKIKYSENNAKLIKAYIYRKISEKNPQMGGLDKILSISKMSDQQLIDMVEKMPDLEDLEKSIKKHIEEKKKEKPKDSNKSKYKSDMSETIDFDISETDESENPKKKSKDSKDSKTKKSKKSSKKSSKK